MTRTNSPLAVLASQMCEIRALTIEQELANTPFVVGDHPEYAALGLKLVSMLLPQAAAERANLTLLMNPLSESTPDHQVANRATRLMIALLNETLYERFNPSHQKMPRQLANKEWPDFMELARNAGLHHGYPIWPVPGFGVDTTRPLDYVSLEQSVLAKAKAMGRDILAQDPLNLAIDLQKEYANVSTTKLVQLMVQGQSLARIALVASNAVETDISDTPEHYFEVGKKCITASCLALDISLSAIELEAAIQAFIQVKPTPFSK